jgi:hypothetical protein
MHGCVKPGLKWTTHHTDALETDGVSRSAVRRHTWRDNALPLQTSDQNIMIAGTSIPIGGIQSPEKKQY